MNFSINGNLVCDQSDHLPIFFIPLKHCLRDYSTLEQEHLLLDVQWETMFMENGRNQIFDYFYSVIYYTIDNMLL